MQLGGRGLAQARFIKSRLFHEQNAIMRTRRQESENATGRPGAGDRDVIQAHRSLLRKRGRVWPAGRSHPALGPLACPFLCRWSVFCSAFLCRCRPASYGRDHYGRRCFVEFSLIEVLGRVAGHCFDDKTKCRPEVDHFVVGLHFAVAGRLRRISYSCPGPRSFGLSSGNMSSGRVIGHHPTRRFPASTEGSVT